MRPSYAQLGYEAYGDTADWKAYDGKPMPQWDELPEHIRTKWHAAAQRISMAALADMAKVMSP